MTKYYELGNGPKNMLANTKDENKYDNDESLIDFDINRKNDSHMAIIRQIKDKSEILDVGCASGMMGEILKKHKAHIVDGIEYDKKAFEVAKSRNIYRDVFNFSILDKEDKKFLDFMKLKRKYDYIIFGDVLEHLVNPWEALINVKPLLKKDGAIIISLPNICNVDTIRAMFNNEFNYQLHGVFDTTHIRFFSSTSFVDMIKTISENYNVHYNIELCETIKFIPPYYNQEKIYDLFQIDGNNLDDFLILQNIFKLTLSKDKKIKIKGIKDNSDYFDRLNDYLIKKHQEYENCLNEINILNKELNKLNESYNQVINSKGWRILEKLRKIKNSILPSNILKKKIMVYTIITGNYDKLQDVPVEKNIDYYCFTDDLNLKSDIWKIIHISNKEGLDITKLQRRIKALGDRNLEKKYDYIVYMDANMILKKSVREFIKNECNLKKYDIVCLKHPERDCIYDEIDACLRFGKENEINTKLVRSWLEKEKFPKQFGLTATGFFVRKKQDKKMKKLMHLWADCILKYSKRDQLSFMYCVWKEKYNKIQIVDINCFDNNYFKTIPHFIEEQQNK